MLTQTTQTQTRSFNEQDAKTILSIIENQPLQNMNAAREIQALSVRFAAFVNATLTKAAAKDKAKK